MIFKNEDMDVTCMGNGVRHGISVNQANRIFNEWLEKQPAAYKYFANDAWFTELEEGVLGPGYKARLVCIEEIKSE